MDVAFSTADRMGLVTGDVWDDAYERGYDDGLRAAEQQECEESK